MCEPIDYTAAIMRLFTKKSELGFSYLLREFSSLTTHPARISFVNDFLKRHCPNFFPAFIKDVKSDVESTGIRHEGNRCFKERKDSEALNYFTRSIATAKSDEVLALGYANRSAVLVKLQLYTECVEDIDRAYHFNYPHELRQKLNNRRESCQGLTGRKTRAYEPTPIIPENERNPLIQCARNCVKIVDDGRYGRHVVATRDIEMGEVLAVEQADAVVLTGNDSNLVHCHHCFELCYNLIPCKQCTKALFCSGRCMVDAWKAYHEFECALMASLDAIEMDPGDRLALKMALIAREEIKRSHSNYSFNSSEVYCSNTFKEIALMEKHLKKRTAEDLLEKTVRATILYHLIKTHTNFLQTGIIKNRFKEILLDLILICGINRVNVQELTRNPTHSIYEPSIFGTGVYSFNSLFNHSCVENVVCQFHGSTMVMWALSSILDGEQCFVSYGPNFMVDSKKNRQKFLSEHKFFTCKCRACEESWPTNLHTTETENSAVFVQAMLKIKKEAHVETARHELPELFVKAKYKECTCPPGGDRDIKETLWFCHSVLGNKRRI